MTTLTTPMHGVPHRTASTALGLVPAALALAATVVLAAAWRDDLPDPVATHFGPDGADGYTALAPFVGLAVALFGILAAGAWLLAVHSGRDAMTRRIATGLASGIGVFGAALTTGTLAVQRGLDDAAAVPDIDSVILAALLCGLTVGGLCAWATPGDPHQPVTDAGPLDGPRIPLGEHERAAWTGRVVSRVALAVGGGAAVVVTGVVIVSHVAALIVLVAVLVALVLTSAVIVVTVDARGLTARSALGWPRFHVPLDEVASVRVRLVRPLREFGGWGFRTTLGGTVGYVVRTGEAIEVARSNGRSFVVTVDDAATGAALLTTLADRARRRPGS
ncbi:DUF1648 domain-containing protein [Cellulomonas hominis]|uniref:DUF1648 domain-containing protein n=1 Tax=Cellulomonas hominis TaxID=156981 RepID=UPI001B94A742|nr:DUF1648 domain-containing protein [Cellulomonas hominis]VTR77150.1 hypothetical protein CHMI_01918 [Cellulomonas hominis]